MLGCSISRFSRGLGSRTMGKVLRPVKQGGGVRNQLSCRERVSTRRNPLSSSSSSSSGPPSGSVSAVELREVQEA